MRAVCCMILVDNTFYYPLLPYDTELRPLWFNLKPSISAWKRRLSQIQRAIKRKGNWNSKKMARHVLDICPYYMNHVIEDLCDLWYMITQVTKLTFVSVNFCRFWSHFGKVLTTKNHHILHPEVYYKLEFLAHLPGIKNFTQKCPQLLLHFGQSNNLVSFFSDLKLVPLVADTSS